MAEREEGEKGKSVDIVLYTKCVFIVRDVNARMYNAKRSRFGLCWIRGGHSVVGRSGKIRSIHDGCVIK